MKLVFTPDAARDIEKLPPHIGHRIVKKMQWFAAQEYPLTFAKLLKDKTLGSHRFRVGDYRILVDAQTGIISILFVLGVRHRKDVYRL